MKNKKDDWDDGRVVAPMNVEGMPWHDDKAFNKGDSGTDPTSPDFDFKSMTKEQKREYRKDTFKIMLGILKFLIPLVLLFVVVFWIAITMMTVIW